MKITRIHPLYSMALTILAMAACGYLNKERLNPKPHQKHKVTVLEVSNNTAGIMKSAIPAFEK